MVVHPRSRGGVSAASSWRGLCAFCAIRVADVRCCTSASITPPPGRYTVGWVSCLVRSTAAWLLMSSRLNCVHPPSRRRDPAGLELPKTGMLHSRTTRIWCQGNDVAPLTASSIVGLIRSPSCTPPRTGTPAGPVKRKWHSSPQATVKACTMLRAAYDRCGAVLSGTKRHDVPFTLQREEPHWGGASDACDLGDSGEWLLDHPTRE